MKIFQFRPKGSSLGLISAGFALLLYSQSSNAHCITSADQLVAAINHANGNNRDDVISLCNNTIVLKTVQDTTNGSSGLPSIQPDNGHSLTIENGTITRDAISAPPFRILNVQDGATLTLTNVLLQSGSILDGVEAGGAIYNAGTLTLNDCAFAGNAAGGDGGAIFNAIAGQIQGIIDCQFIGNNAEDGGGIENEGNIINILNTEMAENVVTGDGGGIDNEGNISQISYCSIHNNSASDGGGIYNDGTLAIDNSVLDSNHASNGGGGIWTDGPISSINNTTISNNTSVKAGGGIFNSGSGVISLISNSTLSNNSNSAASGTGNGGGAIVSSGTITTIENVTIANNSTNNFGGGIFLVTGSTLTNLLNTTISGNTSHDTSDSVCGGGVVNSGHIVTIESTIVAGNFCPALNPPDFFNNGSVSNELFNLIGDNAGAVSIFTPGTPNSHGSYVGTASQPIDPRLGVLANYGGPTLTMLPFSNSPAIGAGNADSLEFDQRGPGFPRETFGRTDIGAVQAEQTNPPGPQGPTGPEGLDGFNGANGKDWVAGPFMPLPPVLPPMGGPAPEENLKTSGKAPADTMSTERAPRTESSDDATHPSIEPAHVHTNDAHEGGCSQRSGQGQAANNVLLLLMLGVFGIRTTIKSRRKAV